MISLLNLRNNLSSFIIIIYPSLFILGSALLNIFTLLFLFLNLDRLVLFIKNKNEKFIVSSFFIFVTYCIILSFTAFDLESSIRRSLSFLFHGLFFFSLWAFSRIEFNHKKFIKILLLSVIFINSFVLIDTTIQFFLGSDLFNFQAHRYRLSGPFNDEYVVGSFLYKFSILSVASIILLFKRTKLLITFYIIYSFIIVLLSGERASILLFSFCILISLFFIDKNYKKNYFKYFISFLFFFSIVLISVFKVEDIKISKMGDINYIENKRSEITLSKNNGEISNFNYRIFWIYDRLIVQTIDDVKFFQDSSYFILYKSALKVWSENKPFGVGLKNFRLSCKEIKLDSNNNNYPQCSTHPHNFILEILSEIGIIGLILFLTFVYSLIIKIYSFIKVKRTDNYLAKILIIILLAIIFPLIPTGSFFSTFNSSFFWYFLSILFYIIGLYEEKKN